MQERSGRSSQQAWTRSTAASCAPQLRGSGPHRTLYGLYRHLLELRRELAPTVADEAMAFEAERVLMTRRAQRAWFAVCFEAAPQRVSMPVPPGRWRRLVASADETWGGPGSTTDEVHDSPVACRCSFSLPRSSRTSAASDRRVRMSSFASTGARRHWYGPCVSFVPWPAYGTPDEACVSKATSDEAAQTPRRKT